MAHLTLSAPNSTRVDSIGLAQPVGRPVRARRCRSRCGPSRGSSRVSAHSPGPNSLSRMRCFTSGGVESARPTAVVGRGMRGTDVSIPGGPGYLPYWCRTHAHRTERASRRYRVIMKKDHTANRSGEGCSKDESQIARKHSENFVRLRFPRWTTGYLKLFSI